jgi:hypothetical protein
MFQAPPAVVAEQPAPSSGEVAAIAAQRTQIQRLLDCPPGRGEEVVVCGRRRSGPTEPYRLPLPPSGEEPAGAGPVSVQIAPGVRVEPDVVHTFRGSANSVSVKVKF